MDMKVYDEIVDGIRALKDRGFEPHYAHMHPEMGEELRENKNRHTGNAPPSIHGADIVLDGALPEERIVLVSRDAISDVTPVVMYAAGIEVIEIDKV